MFESYSKQAFAEAKASLKILDENIIYDFGENTPEGIPLDREWQGDGLLDLMFNSEKKRLAKKRVDFNAGVMTTVCLNHFDGNSKDLEKFCVKAIKATVFSGSKVASDFKKAFNNQTAEYKIGKEWGNGFIDRYIDVKHSTISGDEDSTISADDIWGASDENNDSVPEKENSKIEEFDPYEQRRLETLSEIDDAKPYFKKLKKIASETKTKRFDFYRSWMKKQKLMEDQQKDHFEEFRTINDTRDEGYILSPSRNWGPKKKFDKMSQDEFVKHANEFYSKMEKFDTKYWYEKCAEQAFHIHKTFLQELNTYILALNNAGFEFELKVDKSYDPNAFKRKAYDELISFEEFIGRYPKIAQFRISLFYVIKKAENKKNLTEEWLYITGYTKIKPDVNESSRRVTYPANLDFYSETSESWIEYRNNYVLSLLETFDQEKFKQVQEVRENYNDYVTDRHTYDISYPLDFFYKFESCLDNFCLEEVPFEKLPYIKRSLNSLLPQELYWHEEKELYEQLNS